MADTHKTLDSDLPELMEEDAYVLDGQDVEMEMEGEGDYAIEASAVQPLAAEVIPPERVRFTTPVELRVEGDEERYVGAVLNLSQNGVACTVPVELCAGQRVWIRFRLGLADEAVSLLCVVIWRREVGQHDPIYGLQFGSLAEEEREHIGKAVAERAEGRAGEWPLPLMPSAASAPKEVRGTSPWVSAAAGMLAGIALALVLSAIPNFGAERSVLPAPVVVAEQEAMEPDAPRVIGPADSTPSPAMAAAAPSAPVEEPKLTPPPAAAAPATPPAAVEVQAQVAAVTPTKTEAAPMTAEAAPAKTEAAPAKAAKASEPTVAAPMPRKPAAPVSAKLETLRPVGTPRGVELGLATDGPVTTHNGFWLDNPRRYVVDVDGRKSGFAANAYEVKHPLVTRLRIGEHAGRVRFVLDVSPSVRDDVRVRAKGSSVVVELQKR